MTILILVVLFVAVGYALICIQNVTNIVTYNSDTAENKAKREEWYSRTYTAEEFEKVKDRFY